MAKVTAQTMNRTRIQVNLLVTDSIDQEKLWVHYDDGADSMVIYLTGAPVFAVSVHIDDDTYLKVNPKTGDIVGFHVEAWERGFLPTLPELQALSKPNYWLLPPALPPCLMTSHHEPVLPSGCFTRLLSL